MSELHSFQDYHSQDLRARADVIAALVANGRAYRCCFAQPSPDTVVFPDDLAIEFVECDVSNCVIPVGCSLDDISISKTKRYATQNDGDDWVVDSDNNPLYPVNLKYRILCGMSINPADIPEEPVMSLTETPFADGSPRFIDGALQPIPAALSSDIADNLQSYKADPDSFIDSRIMIAQATILTKSLQTPKE